MSSHIANGLETVEPDEALMAKLELLPASPTLLVELRRVIDSGTAGASEVADLIKGDPGLVATILRLIHSAYYRLPAMTDLRMAIAYIGLREIYRLVVAASVVNAFRSVDEVALRRHWRRAYVSAALTRDLTRSRARFLSTSEGWTLGLLHDIGALVRLVLAPSEAWQVEHARDDKMTLYEGAERAAGVTPAPTFGVLLCRAWNLPVLVETVCACQRTGAAPAHTTEEERGYTPLVGAASLLAELVVGQLSDEAVHLVRERVKKLANVDDDGFWSLVADARDLLEEADAEVEKTLAPAN